eukprot:319913-Heterocapsa_arctica.AAC.1
MGKGQSNMSAYKWHEKGIGRTRSDIQDGERRYNNKIGYIMFEDLANKDEANRTQAVNHAYCMKNKLAVRDTK